MKLSDLIELFVEREVTPLQPVEVRLEGEHKDTSSLADIARILRELDGYCELDQERR